MCQLILVNVAHLHSNGLCSGCVTTARGETNTSTMTFPQVLVIRGRITDFINSVGETVSSLLLVNHNIFQKSHQSLLQPSS